MIGETLSFGITNNTNGTVPLSIFGNNADPNDNSNVTTRYFWDVTSYSYDGNNNLSVVATSGGVSNTYTTTYSGNNLAGVVNALNQLNIGSFFLTTSGGSTFMNIYSPNFTFGSLTIGASTIFDTTFVVPSPSDGVPYSTAFLNDGRVVVVGAFTLYGTSNADSIVCFNTDGSIDTTFQTNVGTGCDGFNAFVVKVRADGRIIVGGAFSSFNGTPTNGIVILNTNGTISNIQLAVSPQPVQDLIIDSSNRIVTVGGGLTGIQRFDNSLNVDGTFAPVSGFTFGFTQGWGIVEALSGKYIVVGDFTAYDGNAVNYIVRINTSGTFDGTFNIGTGFNAKPNAIGYNSKGQFIVVGNIATYNGNAINRIVGLDGGGNFDNSFTFGSGFSNATYTIQVMSDDRLIIGGTFLTYQGQSYPNIIRLEEFGNIDTTWNVGTGFDSGVYGMDMNNGETQLACTGNFNLFDGYSSAQTCVLNL
jgi:hypothetical protein